MRRLNMHSRGPEFVVGGRGDFFKQVPIAQYQRFPSSNNMYIRFVINFYWSMFRIAHLLMKKCGSLVQNYFLSGGTQVHLWWRSYFLSHLYFFFECQLCKMSHNFKSHTFSSITYSLFFGCLPCGKCGQVP
jgi:hypothetical protein